MHDRPNGLVLLTTFALVGALGGCAMPLRDRGQLACISARETFHFESIQPCDEAIGLAPRASILLSGTASVKTWQRIPSAARVVLMTPDIELSELSTGGVLEPQAEWTERAKVHVVDALMTEIASKNANLEPYRAPANDSARAYQHNQLIKLHDVVADTILVQLYYGFWPPLVARLPGGSDQDKYGKFDWTLGEGVGVLREDANADYALFVFLRESYGSAERKANLVVEGVLTLRNPRPAGMQVGFASLVDLTTGEIVWFNRVVRREDLFLSGWSHQHGDLRDFQSARSAVKKLLTDLPL